MCSGRNMAIFSRKVPFCSYDNMKLNTKSQTQESRTVMGRLVSKTLAWGIALLVLGGCGKSPPPPSGISESGEAEENENIVNTIQPQRNAAFVRSVTAPAY